MLQGREGSVMKIIAESPAEEALLQRIKALSDELVNQDNRHTSMPVWTILDNNKAGKDYVWQNGYRSADFCVGDSGIPKYPKSWKE